MCITLHYIYMLFSSLPLELFNSVPDYIKYLNYLSYWAFRHGFARLVTARLKSRFISYIYTLVNNCYIEEIKNSKNPCPRSNSKQAFSLVSLLVVIASGFLLLSYTVIAKAQKKRLQQGNQFLLTEQNAAACCVDVKNKKFVCIMQTLILTWVNLIILQLRFELKLPRLHVSCSFSFLLSSYTIGKRRWNKFSTS